jgi:DNA-binding GntR family transcriptional regulator
MDGGHIQKPANKPRKKTSPRRLAHPKTPEASQPNFSRPEWLASVLRDRIVKGLYKPGDRIRENDLQQEFQLSNGPVREAIQKLVGDGILERSPWRGARVVELNKAEIVELFELRLALLEYAAEQAARRAPADVIKDAERVRRNLQNALKKVKSGDLALMSAELIEWILRGANNKRLFQVWENTLLISRVYAYESMRRTAARTEPLQYRIIDAIVTRNAAAARQAMRELTIETVRDLNIEADL